MSPLPDFFVKAFFRKRKDVFLFVESFLLHIHFNSINLFNLWTYDVLQFVVSFSQCGRKPDIFIGFRPRCSRMAYGIYLINSSCTMMNTGKRMMSEKRIM